MNITHAIIARAFRPLLAVVLLATIGVCGCSARAAGVVPTVSLRVRRGSDDAAVHVLLGWSGAQSQPHARPGTDADDVLAPPRPSTCRVPAACRWQAAQESRVLRALSIENPP